MNTTFVIKEAILSEKAHAQMAQGIYAFRVDRKSNKKEIASAVKKQFAVDVVSVRIIAQSPKKRRITGTRREVEVKGAKKAIIKVRPGQTIALLSPKTDVKKEKGQKAKVTKKPEEKSEAVKKGLLSKIRGNRPPKGREKTSD